MDSTDLFPLTQTDGMILWIIIFNFVYRNINIEENMIIQTMEILIYKIPKLYILYGKHANLEVILQTRYFHITRRGSLGGNRPSQWEFHSYDNLTVTA